MSMTAYWFVYRPVVSPAISRELLEFLGGTPGEVTDTIGRREQLRGVLPPLRPLPTVNWGGAVSAVPAPLLLAVE